MKAAVFDQEGRFLQTINGPLELVILPTVRARGARWAAGDYDNTYYLSAAGPVPRPDMDIHIEGLTLSSVPPSCLVHINQQAYFCEDGGTIELEFDQPGTYTVRLECWPYLDKEFQVEA